MRVPFIAPLTDRTGALVKDGQMLNCYVERTEAGRTALVQRPGPELHTAYTAGTARGMFAWNDEIVTIIGTKIKHNNTNVTTVTAGSTIYWFGDIGSGDADKFLFLHDGTTGYYLEEGWTATPVTATAWVTTTALSKPYVDGVAVLDSYICTMNENGVVRNSEVVAVGETPNSWPADGYKTAESEPSKGVHITQHVNYLMLMKEHSIEFWYNAANAIGSPFNRADSGKMNFGCAGGRTVARLGDIVIFVSESGNGRSVMKVESMRPQEIGSKAINRIVQGATLTDAYAGMFRLSGHTFYSLLLPTAGVHLLFDIKEGFWMKWTNGNGDPWPYVFPTNDPNSEAVYFLHRTNGHVVKIDPDAFVFSDEGTAFVMESRTDYVDFGDPRFKEMSRHQVIADTMQTASGDLLIAYSDDDFGSFGAESTHAVSGRIQRWNMGRFRRRALRYRYSGTAGLRLFDADFDIEPIE